MRSRVRSSRHFGIVLLLLSLLTLHLAPQGAEARRRRRARSRRAVARVMRRAEQAFAQQRYRRVISQLQRLGRRARDTQRALFLRAYAHYKLDQLRRAEVTLEKLLKKKHPQPAHLLLRGMLSMERGRWTSAREALRRATKIKPRRQRAWRARRRARKRHAALLKTAQALLARVDRELAEEARKREEAAKREEERKREEARRATLVAAKARLEVAVKGRDFMAAEAALKEVESLEGITASTHYYRGYIHFERGRYAEALVQLKAALKTSPADRWSRYMLAMTRAKLGQRARARRTLLRLARGHDDVARDAAKAAKRLRRKRARPKPPSKPPIRLGLELGGGADTNPSFLDEVGGSWQSLAPSLRAGAHAAYEHALSAGFFVEPRLRFFHRSYARATDGDEQDELAGGLALRYRDRRLELEAAYCFETFFYGYELLSLRHRSTLSGGLALTPWLGLIAQTRLAVRDVRREEYAYLEDFELGAFTGLRLVLGPVRVEAGYELLRSISPALRAEYEVNIETGSKSPRKPSRPTAIREAWVPYLLEVNYTFWGHGPALWTQFLLPWKLKLVASVALQWRGYDLGDRLTQLDTGEATDYAAREDLRISGEALLERMLGKGFAVRLGFEFLENLSSLDDRASGWDRNYSRRLIELRLAWELR